MTQSMQQGFVHGGPRLLLRIEGLAYLQEHDAGKREVPHRL